MKFKIKAVASKYRDSEHFGTLVLALALILTFIPYIWKMVEAR